MLPRPDYGRRQVYELTSCVLGPLRVSKAFLFCIVLTCVAPVPVFAGGLLASKTPAAPDQFELSAPASDVLEAVRHVCQDQIVHGTYVYEKEKTLRGAQVAKSSNAFHDEKPAGEVCYKVAKDVLDPRHFRGSNGLGTLTVRYIVNPMGPDATSVRIDAVFVEAERRRADKSDGTVESAEYDAVRSEVEEIQQARLQPAAQPGHNGQRPVTPAPLTIATAPPSVIPSPVSTFSQAANAVPQQSSSLSPEAVKDLQRRVSELRSQVEGQVKSDGTLLRQAPITRSTTMDKLPAASTVVILVITPKWYGVETANGHRGWVRRDELEPRQ